MIPIIALVGRANVGKSTLFNRLTKSRDALVADVSGLTRDRKYGRAFLLGQEFIIIDTGGINGSEEKIQLHVFSQSLLAIQEADIIFFLVDICTGIIPLDYKFIKNLRSSNKEIYLLINKTDGCNFNNILSDFCVLGIKNIYPIAALYGFGIFSLIKKVIASCYKKKLIDKINNFKLPLKLSHTIDYFSRKKQNIIKNTQKNPFDPFLLPIRLAIVGRPNVGKSTLINNIVGENRVVVYDMPGTTRDSIDIPIERNQYKYILIDTAGIRKKKKITEKYEKFSIMKTLESIEYAHVVLLLMDAKDGVFDQDLSLLDTILHTGRSLVIVINKWDTISWKERKSIKSILNLRLTFVKFVKIHFISALYGSGVDHMFQSVNASYLSATRRMSTSLLTRMVNMAEKQHQPPLIRGRRMKMKYAHAIGYNPPVILVHGNQVEDDIPSSYKRYLSNYFCKKLHMIGTPVRIEFKKNYNPYV
ncbi:ribosome biogenesis GTPase Der [Arsenophonus symbiont of Ornithomya chloropus]|uniref:ribosome biogenesis GTPase Der n=1 Tax=Arsenophonus symbiont of Ornithomya chloropus TaxID=634121 RepID=UPI0032B17DA6